MPESLTRKETPTDRGRLQIGTVAAFKSERWPASIGTVADIASVRPAGIICHPHDAGDNGVEADATCGLEL